MLGKKPIDGVIKSNRIKFPGKNNLQKSKPKQILTPAIVSKLKSSFEYRQKEVSELFQQKLFWTTQSIAKDEFSLYHGTKSDRLKRLDNIPEPSISYSSNNAILFYLLSFIRVKTYSNCKNFTEFTLFLYQHFSKLCEGCNGCEFFQIGILKAV